MPIADANWAEIRRAYEAGLETVAALATRCAVSADRIYRRARKEGWTRRSSRRVKQAKGKRAAGKVCGAKPRGRDDRKISHVAMIQRLYRAIDENLKRLEARMGSGREVSAAESARETRELGVMIRSFEKVTAFATDIERSRKPAAPERISSADAERMREEIAKRLERLNGEGNPGAGSRPPKR
ncbi:hypothetical protein [Filomicrobium sp.]|uniref:hypothetical protein n=1 Tax=Filomicrobium sp. TaxID=2024831 RepID=UPI0025833DF2|nr:hypothetical protein [Filomicrobium sp.]MCV0370815.1 hypothetical protein [Filomicrobium sp.]